MSTIRQNLLIDARYRRIHETRPFINKDSMIYKKMLTISAKCKRIQHCAGFYTIQCSFNKMSISFNFNRLNKISCLQNIFAQGFCGHTKSDL